MSWGAAIVGEVVGFILGLPLWFKVVVVVGFVIYILLRLFFKGFNR